MSRQAAQLKRMLGFVLLGLLAVILLSKMAGASGTSAATAASGPVDTGANVTLANSMLAKTSMDGPGQQACLDELWTHESGFSASAANASGAYGIPQALPGDKMASAGADWRTNPATQIAWGLEYISGRYGNPCAAWTFEMSHYPNWY